MNTPISFVFGLVMGSVLVGLTIGTITGLAGRRENRKPKLRVIQGGKSKKRGVA